MTLRPEPTGSDARCLGALALGILMLTAGGMAQVAHAQAIPQLSIADGEITVSGISSGAYMANQYHVAHSASVSGAGLVAGGLYGCSVSATMGNRVMATATRALTQCMHQTDRLEGAARFIDFISEFDRKHLIDPVAGLKGDVAYLFSGRADTTVGTRAVETAAEVLTHFGVETTLLTRLPDPQGQTMKAGHSFVTVDRGNPCETQDIPYVNACGYDQAGAILSLVLRETLVPPSEAPAGKMMAFDQAPFIPGGKKPLHVSMGETAFLYVPDACTAADAGCRLHVAFHGCQQSDDVLGPDEKFYEITGYNRWADTNRVVVLYPQAHRLNIEDGFLPTEFNPKACWNWWGYAYDSSFLLKAGAQIGAVKAMVDALQGR